MSTAPKLSQFLRPYWTDCIWQVEDRPRRGLLGWIASADYQVYDAFEPDGFSLYYAEAIEPAEALAFDATRFAAASFETIHNLPAKLVQPKALGWLLIQAYYAAFFSIQALLRLHGLSLIYIEASGIKRIADIAAIYGQLNEANVATGWYVVRSNAKLKRLEFKRANDKGSHVAAWKIMTQLLSDLSTNILLSSSSSAYSQAAATRLVNLRLALTENGGRANGSWLSVVRNNANYQLDYGVWYPYKTSCANYKLLPSILTKWRSDPLSWDLSPDSRELQRFLECCSSLVGICREVCLDMEASAPSQRSFHRYAATGVLRHYQIP